MEVIVTIYVSVDDIHSKGIGVIFLEIFLVENDVTVLFVFGDGDEVGEDVMLFRHEGAHLNGHVLKIPGFGQ